MFQVAIVDSMPQSLWYWLYSDTLIGNAIAKLGDIGVSDITDV